MVEVSCLMMTIGLLMMVAGCLMMVVGLLIMVSGGLMMVADLFDDGCGLVVDGDFGFCWVCEREIGNG